MTNDLASALTDPMHLNIATSLGVLPALSIDEETRLTRYKWRYALEFVGFSAEQADRLIFFKWLFGDRGVQG